MGVRQKEEYFIENIINNKINPIKGVKKLMNDLKQAGFKIGLGTSAPIYKAFPVLENLGINDFFDATITDEEVSNGKPDPEVFLKAAKKLDIKPEDCVVIEDAPNGIDAAKNGGMKCIGITTTHKKEALKKADIIINSFDELTVEKIQSM